MISTIAAKFPAARFKVILGPPASLRRQVMFFRQVQCILAVRGGFLANCIWMVPGSIMIEIQAKVCDGAFLSLARICGLRTFETTFPIHTLHNPFPADIDVVVRVVQLAMMYL
jgi:capsular polysaccharide biosynthesis protein